MTGAPARWVPIATFYPSQIAELATDLLRQHGVRVWLRPLADGFNEGLAFVVGSEILVLSPDLDAARSLVRSHFGEEVLT